MEKTEKFRMRRYSKTTATNIYAAPLRDVNYKADNKMDEQKPPSKGQTTKAKTTPKDGKLMESVKCFHSAPIFTLTQRRQNVMLHRLVSEKIVNKGALFIVSYHDRTKQIRKLCVK